MEEIRLNKYLSMMGVCSRREADRLIEEGRVLVDGERAVTGMKVTMEQYVVCDGRSAGRRKSMPAPEERSGETCRKVLPAPEKCSGEIESKSMPAPEERSGKSGRKILPMPEERSEGTGSKVLSAPEERSRESGRKALPVSKERSEGTVAVRPRPVLLMVNKPRGVVCTTSQKDRALNIVELVHYPERVYPVGRLDKDSEGLIFMTNQGDLVNRIMRGSSGHEKEYVVVVNKPLTEAFIRKMRAGVWLEDLEERTKPCKAWITGKREFHIVLTQGLNRQIRRMCGALGYQVQSIQRIRIMNIRLGNLKSGTFRKVTEAEYEGLLEMLEP